jgi:hypothetical protein
MTRLPLLALSLCVLTCQRPPPIADAARQLEEPEDPPGFGSGWGRGQEMREEEPPPARRRTRRAPAALAASPAAEEFDSSLLEQVDAALAETKAALGAVRKAKAK